MSILRTKNLNKVYKAGKTEVHALRDVNLEIEKSAFVSIMGPSGSGKSTMLNMLGCLDRPTSGEIEIDGQEVCCLGSKERTRIRREKIGFIFQSFNLIPTLTVLENVALPLRYTGDHDKKAVAAEALNQVGLADRLNFRSNEISGGEQQRVAVARALVLKPSIVLADEPTGELDSVNSEAIIDLLRDLNNSGGQTIIIVTHDPQVAEHTQRTLIMKDGAVHEEQSRF